MGHNSGLFRQMGQLKCVFSTRTKKKRFTGVFCRKPDTSFCDSFPSLLPGNRPARSSSPLNLRLLPDILWYIRATNGHSLKIIAPTLCQDLSSISNHLLLSKRFDRTNSLQNLSLNPCSSMCWIFVYAKKKNTVQNPGIF